MESDRRGKALRPLACILATAIIRSREGGSGDFGLPLWKKLLCQQRFVESTRPHINERVTMGTNMDLRFRNFTVAALMSTCAATGPAQDTGATH
ncbi:hypothetical protein [Paraburkholderia sp. BL25I1N1]|uniref:hypothetical protein n=1 Tax=Paraburkholderia sp. BL25I1N1 TaxID=1938804 RepID=UPI000D0725DB|nr:hypothetical protein [Paraburkholderia sp. BL25I1N1]PRY04058.1 hypothetical protein B0G73_11347 [Paraburkholderia sp. BL25I1N1]